MLSNASEMGGLFIESLSKYTVVSGTMYGDLQGVGLGGGHVISEPSRQDGSDDKKKSNLFCSGLKVSSLLNVVSCVCQDLFNVHDPGYGVVDLTCKVLDGVRAQRQFGRHALEKNSRANC